MCIILQTTFCKKVQIITSVRIKNALIYYISRDMRYCLFSFSIYHPADRRHILSERQDASFPQGTGADLHPILQHIRSVMVVFSEVKRLHWLNKLFLNDVCTDRKQVRSHSFRLRIISHKRDQPLCSCIHKTVCCHFDMRDNRKRYKCHIHER